MVCRPRRGRFGFRIMSCTVVLMEAVSSRPQLTYYRNGIAKTIDCSNVIFVLVSDIGADRMQKIILAHGSRDHFPQAELVTAVKDALDMQWQRLQFGKMVNEVIPFLPLEAVHIAEIITLKFRHMDVAYRNKYWKHLTVRVRIQMACNSYCPFSQ